jgi:amidophosphoribosyltransferase
VNKWWHDECGIVAVFGHPEASNLAYLCLYALQHRGQESAGIVSSDGRNMYSHRSMGLVQDIFNENIMRKLPGHLAIGHVRYSTSGSSLLKNAQPFAMESVSRGRLAVAHNGNLVNARTLREKLEDAGSIFQSSMDTEVIVHLMAQAGVTRLDDRIAAAANQILGAFSLVFLTDNQVAACRDPWGFRPLVLGKLNRGWVIASETCALDLVNARYEREIAPGEIVVLDENGVNASHALPPRPARRCVFEHIYFARPDSILFGESVYEVRKRLGENLWKENPVEADVVISVPDSGRVAAMGLAEAAGLPYEEGLIRNHYVGRTFIEPLHSIRHFGVKVKLNAVRSVLANKRVVVVDDSIVRGTTSQKIVTMIREMGGAKEVHFRISSPPVSHPCFYGIDTPTREELVYNVMEGKVEKICKYITADSLGYLSVPALRASLESGGSGYSFCAACFTGDYPVECVDELHQKQLNLFLQEVC